MQSSAASIPLIARLREAFMAIPGVVFAESREPDRWIVSAAAKHWATCVLIRDCEPEALATRVGDLVAGFRAGVASLDLTAQDFIPYPDSDRSMELIIDGFPCLLTTAYSFRDQGYRLCLDIQTLAAPLSETA